MKEESSYIGKFCRIKREGKIFTAEIISKMDMGEFWEIKFLDNIRWIINLEKELREKSISLCPKHELPIKIEVNSNKNSPDLPCETGNSCENGDGLPINGIENCPGDIVEYMNSNVVNKKNEKGWLSDEEDDRVFKKRRISENDGNNFQWGNLSDFSSVDLDRMDKFILESFKRKESLDKNWEKIKEWVEFWKNTEKIKELKYVRSFEQNQKTNLYSGSSTFAANKKKYAMLCLKDCDTQTQIKEQLIEIEEIKNDIVYNVLFNLRGGMEENKRLIQNSWEFFQKVEQKEKKLQTEVKVETGRTSFCSFLLFSYGFVFLLAGFYKIVV
jgi:hypothetical protein